MTTTTLTERYIAATVKSLTPTAQDDVRAELEASISDAVEARVEQGEERTDAERVVLTELGDPGILAAGYADRPLHLIGPKYYLTWWRLLKLLLIIVPICAMGGVALAQAIAGENIGGIIGAAIGVGIPVIVHVTFWVTLVFFILERTGADTGVKWDVDQLPEPQQNGAGRSELIASLIFLGLAAGAILWDRFRGFVRVGDDTVSILSPDLWPWWITGLFVLLAAEAGLAIAIYASGRWNSAFAVVNTVLAVVFVGAALTLLSRGELVNPEFIDLVVREGGDGLAAADGGASGVLHILAVLTGFGIVAGSAWDIIDGWRKAARAKRS